MMKVVENNLENNLENDCEHDWEFVEDWEGDPSIPNGIRDLSHWHCTLCDLIQTDTPDGFEPDYDDGNVFIDRQNSRGEFASDYVYDPLRHEP